MKGEQTMKKSFAIIALAALVMLAGCKKNDPKPNGTRLIAGIEKHKSDSKTSLDGLQIKWTAGDKLYVYDKDAEEGAIFTLSSGEGTSTGEFTGTYNFTNENVAVYPSSSFRGSGGTIVTMTLPAVQTASGAGSFGNGANPMLGPFSDMDNLTLTSLCGVLCLQLTGNNVNITAIEIVGGPDDKLNGTFTANYKDTDPALAKSGDDGTNTVRLNCEATLTSMAQKFYVVVPAGTLHGFTMKVYDDNNNEIFSKSTANEVPVFVNTLSTMTPVEVVPFNPLATPLTFEAREDGVTVGLNTLDAYGSFALVYSKNGGDWTSLTNAVTLNTGETVSFRGNNQAVFGNKFTCSGPCYIYGNVMSLLHAENYATNYTLSESAFTGLFYNNSNINIPTNKDLVLPATTLANYCYYEMFRDCTGLTRTPELPATTMRFSCYLGMFRGCTGLTTVPADLLPTTTMNNASACCYQEMFYGCENLTAAPNLPATTLAMDCYRSMFYGCKSLTTAPELPVTTLAEGCYVSMFEGCSGLTAAPALPATTLADYCYNSMFYGCSSLTTAPALPATTLANYCYCSMFEGCSGLTTAPALPATTLKSNCYFAMFRNCSNLNSVTCLATSGINQSNSTANWLHGVAPSGTFTKASGANVSTNNIGSGSTWPRSNKGIPSNWDVVNDGPAETTITWTSTFINSVSIMPWGHDSGVSASDGGITATFTENAGLSSSGITIGNSSAYGITFSTTTGNISKIEIYGTDNSANGLPSGWSYDGTKVTWQGTSAPSVTMNGVNAGPGEDVHIDYISQIVFTVQ